jgi:translation initiation factor IF-3
MAFKGDFKDKRKKDFVRHNEQIRVPQILLIENGRNLGVMATPIALARARAAGLDLVEVAAHARPPVCQIMDYGKFMFEKQKKEKDKDKSHGNKDKEISFRYVIDDHDLETKAGQVRRFLAKDHKVRVVVKFKQREKAHKDKGFEALDKLVALVADVASLEKPPAFEGSNIVARLQVKKGTKAE